jgi:ArsR family transcriptional regulator
MEHTGLPKASFDLVVISQALHHIPRPQDALLEAARILRPNGQLLILDLANHNEDWIQDKFGDFWLGFEEDNLQEWLHEAGFFEITIEIAGRDLEYPSIESLVVSALRISAPHGHG